MSEIILDDQIEEGVWPEEFSGAWIDLSFDPITEDTVASLYFDNRFPEGHINIREERYFELPLPQAYISWKPSGECRQIFVNESHRRRGIGTKLCAWARSFCWNQGIIFSAPDKMSNDAKLMFNYISEVYGEPYTDPEESSMLRGYGYWGYLV